ncbi:type II toxin-antitoxin system RelE/ParE family toxin [Candidatus Gracilibacteria bacterium]|nr:type II toxin-antitoxin system RelE/ParE family toxin [Candidatus Gracilibacteria bacterium]
MYIVKLKKPVIKFIEKHQGQKIVDEFLICIEKIQENPNRNDIDIVKLQGYDFRYRLRIGKFRFLYRVSENIITITFYDAGSRGDIYK